MDTSKLQSSAKSLVTGKKEHCLLITLSKDGTSLECVGDTKWISRLEADPELWEKLSKTLVEATKEREDDDLPLATGELQKSIPRLFAIPGSKNWKGNKIRSQLSTYLGFFGYGHKMKKRYGEGQPPKGWPVQVDWSSFKGPSKGCSLPLCTEIICQMLEAQDIDPMSYSEQENSEQATQEAAEEAAEEDAEMDDENENEEVSNSREEPTQEVRKRNISDMLARQAWEENNLPAFKRRKQNMQELASKWKNMESELEDGEVLD